MVTQGDKDIAFNYQSLRIYLVDPLRTPLTQILQLEMQPKLSKLPPLILKI
jgi:hypothetical protein